MIKHLRQVPQTVHITGEQLLMPQVHTLPTKCLLQSRALAYSQ